MKHILEFLGYSISEVDKDLYAELQREPSANEKRYFKIFKGVDGIYRCYPFTEGNYAYTNLKLMDQFIRSQGLSMTVFEYIERKAADLKFAIVKKLTIDDLKPFKHKDLSNIVRGLGFYENKSKSTANYPIFIGKYPDGEKRILGVKHNKGNDEWVAFDNTDGGKLYDCIKLIKQYFPGFRLQEIHAKLTELTNNVYESVRPRNQKLSYNYLKDEPVNRYMVLRGFDKDFYRDTKMFKGLLQTEILVRDDQEFANQAFIVRDVDTNKSTGYIRRNFSLYHENLKGFSGGKNGLFYTNYRTNAKTTVLLAESVENGMSYFQMNFDKLKSGGQALIVATGGNFSNTQKEQLQKLLGKVKVYNLLLLGDNDIGGQKFNCFALQQILDEGVIDKISTNQKDSTICITTYDLSLAEKLAKAVTVKVVEAEDTNLRKQHKICFDYDWKVFRTVNQTLIKEYLDQRITIIRSAESSDFNQDLMNKTGMQKYIDQAKAFGISDKDLLNEPKREYMVNRSSALKNVKKLAEDIKENRITAINAIDLIKEVGSKTPGEITSLLKVVYKGELTTKKDLYRTMEQNKSTDYEREF